jgi:hypothetical protein
MLPTVWFTLFKSEKTTPDVWCFGFRQSHLLWDNFTLSENFVWSCLGQRNMIQAVNNSISIRPTAAPDRTKKIGNWCWHPSLASCLSSKHWGLIWRVKLTRKSRCKRGVCVWCYILGHEDSGKTVIWIRLQFTLALICSNWDGGFCNTVLSESLKIKNKKKTISNKEPWIRIIKQFI